jgi:hypothetical protein
MEQPSQSQSSRSSKSFHILGGLALIVLGLAIRLPHLHQSLWLDEMTTLGDFVMQPWGKVLAAGAGEYVPNNHVLHTILVKLIYPLPGSADALPPREALLRVPACVAGILVPLALAWPLRREAPWIALILGIVTTLHPWLVLDSLEARGYSLMLLLGILATNCLPNGRSRWPIAYLVLLTLATYTVPLAVMLIPAHGLAMWILRRSAFVTWIICAAISLLLVCQLYMPMFGGLTSYYRNPYSATLSYRQFLDALPRYALAGTRLPIHTDPFWHGPAVTSTAIYWALPVIAIVLGSVLGWKRVAIRPALITFGLATLIGVLLPLGMAGTSEPRFVQWILLWFCLAVVSVLTSVNSGWGKTFGILGIVSLISWQVLLDLRMPTNQPIREGMALADQIVPPGREIIVVYIGASEAVGLYGSQVRHHELRAAFNLKQLRRIQEHSIHETGHLPWVVIFFEGLARDRDRPGNDENGLWRALLANYHLAAPRLPGRIAPVAVYAPKRDP